MITSQKELDAIKVVGIAIRTSNAKEFDQTTAKIGATWGRFFEENIIAKIENTIDMVDIIAVYCEYESDCNGEYTLIIGKRVSEFQENAEELGLKTFEIPAQKYIQFTSDADIMPDVCINAWKEIWAIEQTENSMLYKKRNYVADFEIYGESSMDPMNAVVEIFIGTK